MIKKQLLPVKCWIKEIQQKKMLISYCSSLFRAPLKTEHKVVHNKQNKEAGKENYH